MLNSFQHLTKSIGYETLKQVQGDKNRFAQQAPISFIKRLASVLPDDQFTTTITVGELVYGAYKSSRPSYFLEKLDTMVWPNITILSFDEAAARIYGKARADLEKRGISLSEPDMRISAIALCCNLTLITGSIRHFARVRGSRVENWLK